MSTIRPTARCCRTACVCSRGGWNVRALSWAIARASSQSVAECDALRADHQLRGAMAEDAASHDPELSPADGDDARRPARCRHDGPPCGPARAHRAPTGATDPAPRADALAADAATRPTGDCPDSRATPWWDTHVAHKVLSIFEPHTETIRKGKIATPNEFGKLVTIQEAEHQIITGYEVHATRPADSTLWTPALDRHCTIFGRAPDLAAGDRGFSSAANERDAIARGVRRVILPRRGPKSPARRAYERQRWFRRGQRWRVGCEGRISVLKRRHGLDCCRYHGLDGMHRWVGLGVIADNLVNTAQSKRAGHRIRAIGEMERGQLAGRRIATEQLAARSFSPESS